MRLILHVTAVVFLTLMTQIGGLAYLVMLIAIKRPRTRIFAFPVLYMVTLLAAQAVSNRVAVGSLEQGSLGRYLYPTQPFNGLQRQYVTPELNETLNRLAIHMATKFPETYTYVLDGSFPLVNGFPLLPHLSHKDGKKIDIAFYYLDGRPKSPIGYFAFEQPKPSDPQPCDAQRNMLTLRWNMGWLAPFWRDAQLDEVKTAEAIRWLATVGRAKEGVTKIFVEPHLVRSLALEELDLNFQGCRAARHDDHIHFQVK